MVAPGLGHLYLGRPRVAVAVLVALGVVWPLLITAIVALKVPPLWTFAVTASAGWGFALAIAVDAWARARRGGDLGPGPRRGRVLGFLALSIAVGITGSMLRKAYVIDTYATPSGTMEPTIRVGDHVVVTKLRERGQMPARGDLIVFRYPQDTSEVFMKRVVAIAGDTIEDMPEGLVVNGMAWPRRPCDEGSPDTGCLIERAPDGREYKIREMAPSAADRRVTATIPSGQMWVRGDHRRISHDSANFGPVPVEDVLGHVRAIFLPLDRIGAVE